MGFLVLRRSFLACDCRGKHTRCQMCAHLVPYCGQWCIAWQLTDEALTFYSGPCGQFSASRNCGGRLPLTLECSDELWPCGRIIKRSRDTQAKGMRAGCRCSGRGGDGWLRIKDSLMIPLCDSLAPSVSSSPVLIYVLSLCAVVCEGVYP